MAKRLMLIDAAHPEETRVVVLNGNRLEEFDFETSTKKQIKGNIYLAKVTRVEPSLQAAFVEYGGNRHGFLAFNEIHPDYYRIPVADRQAALAAERAAEQAANAREEDERDEDFAHGLPIGVPYQAEPLDDDDRDEPDDHDDGATIASAAPVEAIRGEPEPPPAPEGPPAYEAAPPDLTTAHESPREADAEAVPLADEGREPAAEDAFAQHAADAGDEHYHDDDNGGGPSAPAEPEYAPADAHGDSVETVGGDELEETARPRARPFRHYKIQEVIKRRQIMLVQVVKEERGNKGAALTTYLSLAGRYCVLMPNTPRGGGVSRKITNTLDRRRLKDLVGDLEVPDGMGVIVRTAGSERSKAEIKRDFEYLLRLWDEIRDLTLKSSAPALIYEEGNLIKRSIRDLYARDIDEVMVDGEEGYRTAKAFMKMLMPSHAKRVKAYRDPTVPLFHRHQVEGQIDAIHSPVVQLRSGGYIVLNPTEALVAIDVNSGRSTRERNIEETALKTNIEASDEVARQVRLRDLAGLIVIDYIDMEEYRNRGAVERRLKEAMRNDRARIQLGRISPFGLLELSRQRLRPSLVEASTQPCPYCNGTGHIRSIESTALHVLRAIEEEGTRRRSAEIAVAVPTKVALYVLNQKRGALQQAEQRFGFHVTVTSDDALVPPAFRLDRLRALTPAEIAALPSFTPPPPEPDDDDELVIDEQEVAAIAEVPDAGEPAIEPHGHAESEEGHGRRRRHHGRHGDNGRERDTPVPPAQRVPFPKPVPVLEVEAAADAVAPTQPQQQEAKPPHGDDEHRRRRRGRRGGRRRRSENGGQGARTHAGNGAVPEPMEPGPEPIFADAHMPAASQDEPIAPPPAHEEIFAGAPVPISPAEERVAVASPPPAPSEPVAESVTERAVQYNVPPPHEVSGPASNPRRGWWRR